LHGAERELMRLVMTKKTGNQLVLVDPRYFRPTEVDILVGDATKAFDMLGWQPRVSFQKLVQEMVHHEMQVVKKSISNKQLEHKLYDNDIEIAS